MAFLIISLLEIKITVSLSLHPLFFLEKNISLLVLYHLYVDVQYSPEAKLKTVYIYLNLNARLVKMGLSTCLRSSMAANDGV